MRRVVMTGTGLISALGTGTDKTWAGLMEGKSGIRRISKFDPSKHKVQIAAEVPDFVAEDHLDKKEVRRLDPFCQYALAAAEMAVKESGLSIGTGSGQIAAERAGAIVGSGIGGMSSFEETYSTGLEKGFDRLSPFFVLKMISNMAPGRISLRFGLRGPNWGPVSACSTGANAMGEAYRQIAMGEVDAMVCGGSEAVITPMGIGGFEAMRAMSTRNDAPEKASRPFDKGRDGFVMGEGAGIAVLESYETASARGAAILCEVVGYATNSDAHHETAPSPNGEGAARCMRLGLQNARLRPEQIGYINAHGTSTPMNDASETQAVKSVFGDHAYKLAMSSTKSMTGHTLGAAGGIEAIITGLALKHQRLPPTVNLDEPDVGCDLDYVPHRARACEVEYALSNSFGFGGTNAVLVFKRFSA